MNQHESDSDPTAWKGGFWTAEMLQKRLPDIVSPYDPDCVEGCSYELKVGGEVFVSGDSNKKIILKEREAIMIPPGQLALIITKETVTAPPDALGLLSFKSAMKLRGLINVSGFHIDPGYKGKIVFSVYNAGPQTIQISEGTRLFIIWFCSLAESTKVTYNGAHNGQDRLSDQMVTNISSKIPSPFSLQEEIHDLRKTLSVVLAYAGVAVSIFLACLVLQLRSCADGKQSSSLVNINVPPAAPTPAAPTPAATTPAATTPATTTPATTTPAVTTPAVTTPAGS